MAVGCTGTAEAVGVNGICVGMRVAVFVGTTTTGVRVGLATVIGVAVTAVVAPG